MASKTKHKERSMRRHIQKEAGKNWFFTGCNRFTYNKAAVKAQ